MTKRYLMKFLKFLLLDPDYKQRVKPYADTPIQVFYNKNLN